MSLGTYVAGGALVVVFIGLLLPWLTVRAFGFALGSEDGFNGWGWLSFVALLGGIALVVANIGDHEVLGTKRRRALAEPVAGALLMVAGGAALLGAVVFWTSAPPAVLGVRVGSGLVVSLIGSLGVVGGGAMLRSAKLTRSVQARLRGPRSG